MLNVYPKRGYYLVVEWDSDGVSVLKVNKNRECSCGGDWYARCPHVEAVYQHLLAGGDTAPDTIPLIAIPEVCPICGGEVELDRTHRCRTLFWRCKLSLSHFWEWLGGDKVRRFLTQPHPNKAGAYYTKTIQEHNTIPDQIDGEMHDFFRE